MPTFSEHLDKLVQVGEALIPKAGSYFVSVDARLQSDYAAWRTDSISAITELGQPAERLLRELQSDSRGTRFHTASASRTLGVLKAARFLASTTKGLDDAPT